MEMKPLWAECQHRIGLAIRLADVRAGDAHCNAVCEIERAGIPGHPHAIEYVRAARDQAWEAKCREVLTTLGFGEKNLPKIIQRVGGRTGTGMEQWKLHEEGLTSFEEVIRWAYLKMTEV